MLVNESRSQSVQSYKTTAALVNQLCPNFVFDTLLNYKKEKLSIASLKGKFIILDFWGTFCLPCITAFPKIEGFQKRFGDTLQVLLVATDGYQKAAQFYEARNKSNNPMALPCSVNRNAADYFQIKEVSTYIWIDDQGYIKGITDEFQLTEQNIADFINKKNVQLKGVEKKAIRDKKQYLVAQASEIDSNAVMFSSSLTKYLNGVSGSYFFPKKGIGARITADNASVNNLYRMAFGDSTGIVPYNRLIIESAHPEKYKLPKNEDFDKWKYDNAYCYELKVPKEKQSDILKIMQDDLKRMFGANVYMENRTVQCLILVAEKPLRCLADKTLSPKREINAGGVTVINSPFKEFVELIQHFNQEKIMLDETGITDNVDIALKAQMNDVDALNAALQKYGLHLQYEDRSVRMLIIKDPQ